MAIDYTGNVYTAEEIIRMRERESWEDQIRLTMSQAIASAGLDTVVWILRRIATRESEMRLLQEEPTVERDKLISKGQYAWIDNEGNHYEIDNSRIDNLPIELP